MLQKYSRLVRAGLVLALALMVAGGFQNCGELKSSSDTEVSKDDIVPPHLSCTIDPVNPPPLLSQTCYNKFASATLPAGIYAYEPNYPLWSDGASKARWIYLPPGSKIDNTDVNNWKFPKGTILFKEFAKGGNKLETRMLEKIGTGNGQTAWRASLYIWRVNQSEADLLTTANEASYTFGGDLRSPIDTTYYMPNINACVNCHKGAGDMALGFSSVQLTHNKPTGVNIDRLITAGVFSTPITTPNVIAGSAQDKAALGYIHANCASCHSPMGAMASIDMRHLAGSTSRATENGYVNLIAAPASAIVPGNGPSSPVIQLMKSGSMPKMDFPFLKDDVSIAMLESWINTTSAAVPACATLVIAKNCTPTPGTMALEQMDGVPLANCKMKCQTWLNSQPDGTGYCCRFNSGSMVNRCSLFKGTVVNATGSTTLSASACTKN